MNLFILEPMER